MTRSWALLVAVVVVALGITAILLGNGLLPNATEAAQKGTSAPLVIVWLMVGITALCAGALAAFLFNYGMKGSSGRR